jgi:hypothetical protein
MRDNKYSAYAGAEPFAPARKALGDLVDGEHFLDIVGDDIVYEVRCDLGWPRVVRGRTDLRAQFLAYVGSINKADNGRVIVICRDSRDDLHDGRQV